MRIFASQSLLAVSVIAAVVFGFSALRELSLLHLANIPQETAYFVVPARGFGWQLFISLSPLLLYAGALASGPAWAWSRFGKAAFLVHFVYLLILVSQWAYVSWLFRSIDRNA